MPFKTQLGTDRRERVRSILSTGIGVFNILMGMYGLVLIVVTSIKVYPTLRNDTFEKVFWVRTGICALCDVILVVLGVAMFRRRPYARLGCNLLFAFEIFYFAGAGIELLALRNLSDELGATGGIGNMGLAPQVLTLYPIIALVLINMFKLPANGPTLSARR